MIRRRLVVASFICWWLVWPLVGLAGGGEVEGITAVSKQFYASPHNINFLPEGTLIKAATGGPVYYLQNGRRSMVLPGILDRWLGENHFFKPDIIHTLAAAEVASYPPTASVNKLYIGKVLRAPDGTQYYIDNKLRKRKLSAAVRVKLKFPAGNLYPTSAAHLNEFKSGSELTGEKQPGGMVIYDGPWHGGRMWKIEEETGGTLVKRLYLSDYLYETDGYPDESQRVPVDAKELARYPRGANFERYPDGWVVGMGTSVYVVQGGTLRLVASPELFTALGYQQKHILKVFPEFLKRYPKGQPIAAFKKIVAQSAITNNTGPAAAPNAANNLSKVRPAVRTVIASINTTFLRAFDREPSVAENKFWVDYVYNGEINTQTEVEAAMRRAAKTKKNPARTPRNESLDRELLKTKWLPYSFYFVHQREMDETERSYWEGRIEADRDTIEKLGGTIQWLKDTTGQSHK